MTCLTMINLNSQPGRLRLGVSPVATAPRKTRSYAILEASSPDIGRESVASKVHSMALMSKMRDSRPAFKKNLSNPSLLL